MLKRITSPTGIDASIDKLQELLYTRLLAKWGTQDPELIWNSYPRCYRNRVEDGWVAELYDGADQYREVYWDNSADVVSFFGMSYDIESDLQLTTDAHMVVFVNLARVKPSVLHRADEIVRGDFLSVLGDGWFGFDLDTVEIGLDRCLREYPGSRRDDHLKYVDMHPVHCFRLNFSVAYDNASIC